MGSISLPVKLDWPVAALTECGGRDAVPIPDLAFEEDSLLPPWSLGASRSDQPSDKCHPSDSSEYHASSRIAQQSSGQIPANKFMRYNQISLF